MSEGNKNEPEKKTVKVIETKSIADFCKIFDKNRFKPGIRIVFGPQN